MKALVALLALVVTFGSTAGAFGDYVVSPNQFAAGHDDYYIRASVAVARDEDGSTSLTIDESFPNIVLEA